MANKKAKVRKAKVKTLHKDYVAMKRQLKKEKKEFRSSEKYTTELEEHVVKANTVKKLNKFKKTLEA